MIVKLTIFLPIEELESSLTPQKWKSKNDWNHVVFIFHPPQTLGSFQVPKVTIFAADQMIWDLGSAASREKGWITRGTLSPSASFEKQKRGKTDHFITFIHFNITKFSNSERIVSVSRVVEAAMSLRKNPSLGDRIVVELIGDSFPKFEKSAHPVCPKTFCCYYDGKKTRENFRTFSSDISLEKKHQPTSLCISSLDQLSFYVELPPWLATSSTPCPGRKHAPLRLAGRCLSMRMFAVVSGEFGRKAALKQDKSTTLDVLLGIHLDSEHSLQTPQWTGDNKTAWVFRRCLITKWLAKPPFWLTKRSPR